MVVINEWLPNPKGADTTGEWIELFNNGDAAVSLVSWKIKTQKGSGVLLADTIQAHSYLVLKRGATKFNLRNQNETLSLYNAQGVLVNQSSFLGDAQEGKSWSRISGTDKFVFATPTPGAVNAAEAASLIENNYPLNVPLNKTLSHFDVAQLILGAALTIVLVVLFTIKHNETLSQLFFKRDETIR